MLSFGICFLERGLQEGEKVNQAAVWEKSVPSRGNSEVLRLQDAWSV